MVRWKEGKGEKLKAGSSIGRLESRYFRQERCARVRASVKQACVTQSRSNDKGGFEGLATMPKNFLITKKNVRQTIDHISISYNSLITVHLYIQYP